MEAVALQLSRLALKFNGYDKDGRQGGGKEEDDDLAMSRPVGVSLLLAGIDSGDRPVLYHLDPSGPGITICAHVRVVHTLVAELVLSMNLFLSICIDVPWDHQLCARHGQFGTANDTFWEAACRAMRE